jgi:S1-C subfamily serine protease
MERMRTSRQLIIYTLLIFLIGVFSTGVILTANGFDVPWDTPQALQAEEQENTDESYTKASASTDKIVGTSIIERIVESSGSAVVKLETSFKTTSSSNPFQNDPFFREFFGDDYSNPQTRVQQGLGSGFIISKDGYILTNNHVVEGADEVKVYLTDRNEPYVAKIIGADASLDLAVLKIEVDTDLPMLKMGDSNKTVGVISAKGRPITVDGNEFKDLIQTDASINPGNSGGPLLNMDGEVVGINTAINAQAQGIGFAIPSSTVTQVLDQLLENGKVIRPWLGVYMQPVTDELARYFGMYKAEGALIGAVQEGSPADLAGIQRGDIILEYNKIAISSPEDLQAAVRETQIGDEVVMLVYRNEKSEYVTIKIGER